VSPLEFNLLLKNQLFLRARLDSLDVDLLPGSPGQGGNWHDCGNSVTFVDHVIYFKQAEG